MQTLTFLFTDIEGSTVLLERLRDDYADVLSRHHGIIRASLAAHGGKEVDTAGDGFFAVFTSPSACIVAVIEMQRHLAACAWPDDVQVRVRMGVHTGEASASATGLVGLDVHKAARIAAIGHGGQVLVSQTTAALVRDHLPDDARLRDLGPHRLKDLGHPEQIFQVEADGLAARFPPLRSLDNPELPNNLPSLRSAFIGRTAELPLVGGLVRSSRLVTLTGPGGCGKTRLALQVAADLLGGGWDGVWFVELAPVADPGQVAGAVVSSLGLRPHGAQSLTDSITDVLRDQSVLLILDNCEHVIDACAKLADQIGRACPKVHLLATSREPLAIDGERLYQVPSLSLAPEDAAGLDDLAGSDAVTLFAERAGEHDQSFALDDSSAALVASVCRHLDGIPLALELAAARLPSMSLEHLAGRLGERLRLLNRGRRTALPRQQTLRAAVGWSYDLLSQPERAVLRRLSVFSGSFELEAAEAVCQAAGVESFEVDDLLGFLVDKSLVSCERTPAGVRYHLLETIRQYAAEQLREVDGEDEVTRSRASHAAYYLALAERAAPKLTGPHQAHWLGRLDLDWDNIWATFSGLAAEPHGTEAVLRLAVALDRLLWSRGRVESVPLLRDVLRRADHLPPWLHARALMAVFRVMDRYWDEMSVSRALAEEALRLARTCDDPALLACALGMAGAAGTLAPRPGDDGSPTRLAERGVDVARELGDKSVLCEVLVYLNFAMPEPSLAIYEDALRLAQEAGDLFMLAIVRGNLADIELRGGRTAVARRHCEEGITVAEEIGAAYTLLILHGNLAYALLLQGEFAEAATLFRRSLIGCRQRGLRQQASLLIWGLACCATAASQYHRAALLHGAAEGTFRESWLTELEERVFREDQARLRDLLGDREFEREYRAGKEFSFERAVDCALGRPAA